MKASTNKPSIEFRIDIIIEPDEGSFHAYCPALKGLHVGGDTEEEALQNARDAATAYLESLIKHGDPIPLRVVRRESKILSSKISRYTEELKIACAI
jgi:predicted RNase H-like HicB family nuclease